jgi:hypothetical protein
MPGDLSLDTFFREFTIVCVNSDETQRSFSTFMRKHLLLNGYSWIAALLLGLAAQTFATDLEAIVPVNSLPPAAGAFEMWPPKSEVRFSGTTLYQGTNLEGEVVLADVKAEQFSQITRIADGADEILEFHAVMSTRVPYFRIGSDAYENMGLDGQDTQFRVRVHNRNGQATGRFDLTLEYFSFMLRGHDDQGVYHDAIHVRNRIVAERSGWIEIIEMPNGKWVMKSELNVWPEGKIMPLNSDYFPSDKPAHLELRGQARELRILTITAYNEYRYLMMSDLGTNMAYGAEYSTGQCPLQWVPLKALQDQGTTVACIPPTDAILFRGTARPVAPP